ncbi:Na(+)/H(+) exchange regulatory cofactor NHE-RF1-like [Styela clava]|uniref:Na(+)/H(+) exchange regulatory cofactor NHE-RF1-like n=1 Tax=Styela clava TaxID=7725 RepID=UPI00193A4F9F|nr:Na(+)/H(+) exchange regulatory cofactor NHE-RF1-like [Styela clava]
MAQNGVHKPRLCKVVKGEDGYGFHLHGEKGKVGQRIRKVEEGSAAEIAGLNVGDKIVCVNGHNVEKESHQEVVKRIRERDNETEMLVVDEEAEKYYEEKGIPITLDLLSNGTSEQKEVETQQSDSSSVSQESSKAVENNVATNNVTETKTSAGATELRPRLCKLQKGDSGYGFNLHSEKGKPGRYVRSVDPDSPAANAGMKAGDRIIEVNGTNMEFDKHAKLVTAVKESGDSVNLLVVDEETDDFFKSCEVTVTEKHLTGPLPTPKPPKEVEPKVDLVTMDLNMLKERSQSGRKKKAPPTSDWKNRQAMFNNL